MRRIVKNRSLALVCAMGLALGAGACAGDERPAALDETDPATTAEAPSQEPAYGAGMTQQQARVTGCLERGDIDGTFMLSQARAEGEAGAIGTTGAEAAGSETYRLVHTGDADLSSYVGSRVSVSGRFQATMGGDMGAGTGAGAGVDRSADATAETAPTGPAHGADADATGDATLGISGAADQIVVESVERVEGECPAS